MSLSQNPANDAVQMAEVAMLAQRAGLPVSAADLSGLLESYRTSRAQLSALRAALTPSEEPDCVFSPIRGTAGDS
jgi:hypothetical protein